MKLKRIVDQDLLDKFRALPCCVCGKPGPSDPHHWKSVKSGGHDVEGNILPTCRQHHVEVHTIGRETFLKKYPHIKHFLEGEP